MALPHNVLFRRSPPPLLSLVVPIYNEIENVEMLFESLAQLVGKLECAWEIVAVNDGSSDKSLEFLLQKARTMPELKVISLARNFGHQIAATAGLDVARGDAVVLLDADLQDPPELVLQMIAKYQEGYDVVYATRTSREGESWFKRGSAWLFYRLMRTLVHRDLPPDTGDFRLMSRACLQALQSMRETHRFLRGMVTWVGFPQTSVEFVRPARVAGVTKYSLKKMLLFAWNSALSFSALPLHFSFAMGALMVMVAFGYTLYGLWQYTLGATVPGWMSLLVINCATSGAVLISIGVLGQYVSRIFEEAKDRPLYVIAITANVAESRRAANAHPGEMDNARARF